MRHGWVAALALVAGVLVWSPAWGEDASEADAGRMTLAREIMELTDSAGLARQTVQASRTIFMQQLRQSGRYDEPGAARMWDLFAEEFGAAIPGMVDDIAGAYAAALSEEELRDLRDFYRTPSGQAVARNLPDLVRVGQQLGGQAGQAAALRAEERFRTEREGGGRT